MLGLELPTEVTVYGTNPSDGALLTAVVESGSGINSNVRKRDSELRPPKTHSLCF